MSFSSVNTNEKPYKLLNQTIAFTIQADFGNWNTIDGGEKRVIRAKPPIVVRDFATEIGLKPFKLISELMEMGIFASMNQTIDEAIAEQIAKNQEIANKKTAVEDQTEETVVDGWWDIFTASTLDSASAGREWSRESA